MNLLCGASGCGKTTITRLLNGIAPNYYEGKLDGKILIDSKDVTGSDIYKFSQKVGSGFQNPRSQFYNIDVSDEIAFGCENMGVPKDEIYVRMGTVISQLKIHDLMGKDLFSLSGGEKQKIACASVSTMQPEIFVLDEPSSNLDITAISELKKVVKSWKKAGKTVVIAEHRLYWLTQIADRFIYMKDGAVQKSFSRDEFLSLTDDERHNLCLRSVNPFEYKTLKQNQTSNTDGLKIEDFRFSYKKNKVLDINELKLPVNSVVAVLGENGAGKSTFAKVLCGLEKLSKGKLTLNEEKMKARKRISNCYMVLQDVNHQLFTESVVDEVLLSMINREEDKELAKEILNGLNLENKMDLHPMSLSGGEKQRVVVASAISSDKPIVVFDEPTSGLDYEHMLQVAKNINDLQAIGKSVFLISHDPELLFRCCDYAIFIENGKVKWQHKMDTETANKINTHFKSNE